MAHNLIKIIALSTALVSGAHAQDNTADFNAVDFTPSVAAMGLHLHSVHDNKKFCDSTPGAYVKLTNGFTLGMYKNSECANYSVYAGVTFERNVFENVSVGLTAGVVTGYALAPVIPLLVPSVAVQLNNKVALRFTFAPKIADGGANAVNFAIERRF